MLALIMAFTTLELTDGYASNIFIRDILGLILTFVVAVIILTFSSQRLLFLLKGFIYGNAFFLVLSFIDFYILNIGVFYQKNSWGGSFSGGMPDPNRFGMMLVMSSSALFAIIVSLRSQINQNYFINIKHPLILFVFISSGLFFVNSRSAILIWAFNILFIFSFNYLIFIYKKRRFSIYKNNLKKASALVLILCVGVYFAYSSGYFLIFEKFSSRGIDYANDPRVVLLEKGLLVALERPLVGVGVGGYRAVVDTGSSHNSYLELALSAGLVGASVFYLAFLICFKRALKKFSKSKYTIYLISVSVLAPVFIYSFIINYHFFLPIYMFVFIGVAFGAERVNTEDVY